jgi:hypothetical protein
MNMSSLLPSFSIIIIYFLFTLGGFLLFRQLPDLKKYIPKAATRFFTYSLPTKIVIACIALVTASIIASYTGIPGVYVSLTPLAIAYSLPMIILAGFSYAGFTLLNKKPLGRLIKGWILALLGSFLIALSISNLFPDRHLEYIIVPLCIPAALCINELSSKYSKQDVKTLFSPPKPIASLLQNHIRSISMILIVGIVVIANSIIAYPTIDALNTLDERVSNPCMDTLEWMKGNISNTSTIASDHRLSMLCWAEGFSITYGKTNTTWTATDLSFCFTELFRNNVTHILIDDIMATNVVNVDVGDYYFMTNLSYEKFQQPPFTLIYRNASYDDQHEEIHWVELYEINYSIILQSIYRPNLFT